MERKARRKSAPRRRRAAKASVVPRVKKIFVFMSTTSRDLIDLARNAQVRLRVALDSVLEHDRGSSGSGYYEKGQREVEVHALVHGHQIDGADELGSMEFGFRITDQDRSDPKREPGVQWEWTKAAPTFFPHDTTVVSQWLSRKLSKEPEGGRERILDSTMLIFWGHGLGVGTSLTLPRRLSRETPGTVPHPGLANIGGLRDGELCRKLCATLEKLPPETRELPRDNKFDVLVFDSCLMASVELACEYSGLARYLVASQTLVETSPAGPPGLNLGAVVESFLRDAAWSHDGTSETERARIIREAAGAVADLVGETRSGAQQLTVFALERAEHASKQIEAAETWLKAPDEPVAESMGRLQTRLGSQDGAPPGIVGLLYLFGELVKKVAGTRPERDRIVKAFRNASFGSARQFLDLRDLASQVHQLSQEMRLQMVALALFNELTPKREGFVVAHRAAVRMEDKLRIGGVSIYCPWFMAVPNGRRVFNVKLDRDQYRSLALPKTSGWGDLMFGELFEATAVERETPAPQQEPDPYWDLLTRVLYGQSSCPSCGNGWRPNGLGGKPSGEALGGKPSGEALGGKPSGETLGGKPSGDTLGGKPSGDTLGGPWEF